MANRNDFNSDFHKHDIDQPVTVKDLVDFKRLLINDIKKLLRLQLSSQNQQWLKAFELKKMLRLSDGKLQYLRAKGIIPFKKLGGVTYYNFDEIQNLMASGKLNDEMKLV